MSFISKIGKAFKGVVNVLTLGIPRYLSRKLKEWLNPEIDKEGFKITKYGSDHAIPVVYGRRKVKGIVVERNITDLPGGAKNDTFHMLVIFSHGQIQDFQEWYFNDVISTDDRFKKNGVDMFTISSFAGAPNQTIPDGVGKLLGFNVNTAKYDGLAGALISFTQDKDLSIWKGEPEVSVVMRGVRCYDFRTDTTSYTENPVLHALNYLKSPIYGLNYPDTDIDYVSAEVVADNCDIPSGSNTITTTETVWDRETRTHIVTNTVENNVPIPRFTHNNIIDTEIQIFDNLKEIANSYRGFFPDGDGRIKFGIDDVATPVMEITPEQIMSKITVDSPGRKEFYNRATVRFPNKVNNYEMDEVTWPESDTDPQFLAWKSSDNGLENRSTVTNNSCTSKAEALQLAELIVKISRTFVQVTFTGSPELIQLETGDVVTIGQIQLGYSEETFSVVNIEPRQDLLNDLTLVYHNNSAYPWSDLTYEENIGGDFTGDPLDIVPTPEISITYDNTLSTTGVLTWVTEENRYIRRYRILVKNSVGTPVYETTSIGGKQVIPYLQNGEYDVEIYTESIIGFQTLPSVLNMTLGPRITPIVEPTIFSAPGTITIKPPPTGVQSISYEWEYFNSVDTTVISGRAGDTLTLDKVIPNATYTIRYWIKDVRGRSATFKQIQVNGVEESLSTWIVFADDNLGTNITTDPMADRAWIGFATRNSSVIDTSNPGIFSWFEREAGSSGTPAIGIELTNENITLSADSSGDVSDYSSAVSTIGVFIGQFNDTSNWTIAVSENPSANITGTYNSGTNTYTLTDISVDQGEVVFTATRTGYPTLVKILSISKARQGQTGPQGPLPSVVDNNDGTYTITGENGSIVIEDGQPPTITDNNDGTVTITNSLGQSVIIEDGYTPQLGIDYFDGESGDYISLIFKNAENRPPTPTGGSYDGITEVIPNGWTDDPDDIVFPEVRWFSLNRYVNNPRTGVWVQDGAWTGPKNQAALGADGADGADAPGANVIEDTTPNSLILGTRQIFNLPVLPAGDYDVTWSISGSITAEQTPQEPVPVGTRVIVRVYRGATQINTTQYDPSSSTYEDYQFFAISGEVNNVSGGATITMDVQVIAQDPPNFSFFTSQNGFLRASEL